MKHNITRREFIASSVQLAALGTVTAGAQARNSDTTAPLMRLVTDGEEKCRQLRARLDACASMGRDITLPDGVLALAELFCRFSRSDAGVADLMEPALRSMRYVHSMLDEELGYADSVLAHKAEYPKIPKWNALGVTWKEGCFRSGNQPILLTGMNWDAGLADQYPALFKRLGFNLADGMFRGTMKTDGSFDDAGWLAGDGAYIQRMSKAGIPVDCLLGDAPPEWMLAKYPSMRSPGYGNGDDYVLEDPVDIKYRTEFFNHITPLYARNRSFFAVDLANEPAFQGTSDILMGMWREWLKRKYGDLEELGLAWGVSVGAWEDIKDHPAALVPHSGIWWERGAVDFAQPGMRGKLYDWCAFNNERIGAYFRDLSDRIHAKDPHVATHVKVMMGSYFMGSVEPRGWRMDLSYHTYGIDQENISRTCSLLGGDLDLMDLSHIEKPNRRFGSVPYICGWMDAGMSADFLKSLEPNKPFYNSELHVTEDNTPAGDEKDAKAHIELTLWLTSLHGMSANLLWYWGRNADGSVMGQGTEWFKGSALQQPWLMHGYVRESLNMRRFASPVTSFAQQPRSIGLLYSEASAIQDVHYLDVLRDAYEALNFLGMSIGFVTETHLANEGIPKETRLLIAPNAKYVRDATIKCMQNSLKRGICIAIIGEECLTREPTGGLRTHVQIDGMHRLSISSPQVYHPELDKLFRMAGVHRDLLALDNRGLPAWGVECRTSRDNGRRYAYLANLSREPVTIILSPQDISIKDLRRGGKVGRKVILAPRQIIFGEY